MKDDPHVLRYSQRLEGVDVVCGERRRDSKVVDLTIVARFPPRPRHLVQLGVVVYGGVVPPLSARRAAPFSLARGGDEVWHLEACRLHPDFPVASYLLVGVPPNVGETWDLR